MDISYFDVITDRSAQSGTYSTKWMPDEERFPGYSMEGVIPMWIADMDFRCPPEVIEAVQTRAAHGIFGYTSDTLVRKFIEAATAWMERRYGWAADPAWGLFTPGVVPVINASIQEFTDPGDGVIIQSPVYYPFADGVRNNGRVLRHNCLKETRPGYYEMDFENLEKLASEPHTKLMILSNPHNPVGRVWKEEELRRACEICISHDVVILSDEIHGDLIMKGHRHIPAASLGQEIADHIIAAYAPSKTFNLAGLGTSVIMIPNPELRQRLQKRIHANRLPHSNVFGPLAGETAFRTGDRYVNTLVEYVSSNMDYAASFCQEEMPKITFRKPEGTYMIWLDLRKLGLTSEETFTFFLEQAKVAGDFGAWFGPGGEGFVRLNLACPRKLTERAMAQIKTAYDGLEQAR